jgi:hypothetical protein
VNRLNIINQKEEQSNIRGILTQKNFKEDFENNSIPKELYRNISKRNKIDESDSEDSNSDTANVKLIILPDNTYKSYFDLLIALYSLLK